MPVNVLYIYLNYYSVFRDQPCVDRIYLPCFLAGNFFVITAEMFQVDEFNVNSEVAPI